ncbi:MAG: enoyl-CoA hydratase/isomerase family protein [Alphaproteobacteria bacterium]|nr:enoyl-CoA hydratase/isomerase family protein [Alphaproteobacteria bacterium]
MTKSFIEVARKGHIATVTIKRAEKRNAITNEMMEDLERIGREFAKDEQTRAVIVRGDGNDFSVGADLSQPRFQGSERQSLLMRRRGVELGGQLMRSLQEIHQPTICAVQGIATGAGACIASACDFRIGADNARMGYGEVKIGINLMWTAVPVCVHLVGPSRAKRMIMSGKLFDAATLHLWGFLDEVVPLANLDNTAREWAEEYASLPPIAVQMIKRSVNQVSGALDRAVMHMDADQWMLATQSEDFREAVTAFFDKRKPEFKGN